MDEDNTYIALKFQRCPGCGDTGRKAKMDHTCPYAEDIHGDYNTMCNCCDICEQNCADDI